MPTGPRISYKGKNEKKFRENYKKAIDHGLKFGPINNTFFKKELRNNKIFEWFLKLQKKKKFEKTQKNYESFDSNFFNDYEKLELFEGYFRKENVVRDEQLQLKLNEKPREKFNNCRIKLPNEV